MMTRDRLYPSILAPPCGLSESNTGHPPNRAKQCPQSGSACRFLAQSPCLLDRMTASICNPPEHARPARPSSPKYGDSKRVTTPLLPGRLQTQPAPRFSNDAAETSRRRCRFWPMVAKIRSHRGCDRCLSPNSRINGRRRISGQDADSGSESLSLWSRRGPG
jgi:hypothetical protein